jgi:hypothetical protein
MIVVLKGADFSANNIGKIEVPRELDVKTKQLLSRYSKVLDTSKQYAVDDFVTGLYDNGLADKITCLLLPCLSSSLDEAMINAMNGDSMGQLNSNYWLLRNNGLVQTSVTYGTNEAITRISAYVNVPINNNHYAVYNSENYAFVNTSDTAKQFPTRRNAGVSFYDNCTSSTNSFWLNTCKYGGVSINNAEADFSFGVQEFHQITINDNTFSVKHGEEDKVDVVSETSFPSTYIDDIGFCGNGNNGIKAHSLYSFGFAMTDEEQIIYARLVSNLMKALL